MTNSIFVPQTFNGEKMVSAPAARKSSTTATSGGTTSAISQTVPTVVPESPDQESSTAPSATPPSPSGAPLKMRSYRPITPNVTTDSPKHTQSERNQVQQQPSTSHQQPLQTQPVTSTLSQQQSQPTATANKQQKTKNSHQLEQRPMSVSQTPPKASPVQQHPQQQQQQQQQPQIQIIEFHPPSASVTTTAAHHPPSHLQRQQQHQQQHTTNYTTFQTQPAPLPPSPQHTAASPGPEHGAQPQQSLPPPPPQVPPQRSQAHFTSPLTLEDKVAFLESYWPESKVALLIQLHRKHYNGITSEDSDKSLAAWIALTNEFNSITSDQRSRSSIMTKWDKLMAKYNAERVFVQMQQPASSLPPVSFWNHFQYMDEYLHHVPISTEPFTTTINSNSSSSASPNNNNNNSSSHRKRRSPYSFVDDQDDEELYYNILKRRRSIAPAASSSQSDAGHHLSTSSALIVDSQRMFMEQLREMHKAQVQMMKDYNETMQKSYLEMMSMCGSIAEKSKQTEGKYIQLVESISRNASEHLTKGISSAKAPSTDGSITAANNVDEVPTVKTAAIGETSTSHNADYDAADTVE